MKQAVIAISGSQYQVEPNQIITVDNLNLKEGDKSAIDQVLLLNQDGNIQIGAPTIANVQVKFEVVKNYQGPKIKVFKYKAKSRYRKTKGFRAQLTDIKITDIVYGTH